MTDRTTAGSFRDQLVALLPRLRRFAHGLAGSEFEGDDLVQSACARALERQNQWQPGTRLDSWLFRIIQTIWLDQLRAGSVRKRFTSEQYPMVAAVDGIAQMESHLTLSRVRWIVDGLPPDQRSVILLVCVEGLSYRETAEALGVPAGTVMSRLSRARSAVQRALSGAEPPQVRSDIDHARAG